MNEGAMRQTLPMDGHPPGVFRMAAPSQHEKAFHEAFGIRPGDRMWLDPKDRVAIGRSATEPDRTTTRKRNRRHE
jgi:predicted metalloendopeptidase